MEVSEEQEEGGKRRPGQCTGYRMEGRVRVTTYLSRECQGGGGRRWGYLQDDESYS
jgi:hypothetical protein